MSRVILDTSAYAGFMKGDPSLRLALQQAQEIYVNPVILGELLAGFARSRRAAENRAQLTAFLASPRVAVLAISESTSERYALILNFLRSQGTRISTNDLWIAASAMEHGLCVLTRDAHYLRIPQVVVHHSAGWPYSSA
jgi:predicted nucleic acid-binding protein